MNYIDFWTKKREEKPRGIRADARGQHERKNRKEFHAIILSQLFRSRKSRVQRTQDGG